MRRGTKTVVIDLPDPVFPDIETLRMKSYRLFLARKMFRRLDERGSLYRELLSHFHGRELVDVIYELMKNEGPESETAEAYLQKIADDFRAHSPLAMFLHYLEVSDLERAIETYRFAPMQRRFLEITTITEGLAIRIRCKKDRYLVDEFDCLCEALGLAYRSHAPTKVVPDDGLMLSMDELMRGNQNKPTGLKPVKIEDIIKGCSSCSEGD